MAAEAIGPWACDEIITAFLVSDRVSKHLTSRVYSCRVNAASTSSFIIQYTCPSLAIDAT